MKAEEFFSAGDYEGLKNYALGLETALSCLSKQGPAGPQGPKGDKGDTGPAGPMGMTR